MFAHDCRLTAISVGYRLAPEHPYPAAPHDCFDAAEYLVDHAEELYGAPLRFLGGESAGGCLAALAAFHLRRTRPAHDIAGLVLPFGEFDLTLGLPSVASYTRPLVANRAELERFNAAYVPGMAITERRSAAVSPLFENLPALVQEHGKKLPPALFLCGTEDPLLDDTLLMGMKWMMTGSEAVVKIYPGEPHGFTLFPGKAAAEATDVTIQFVREKLAAQDHV